jgi:hypothetical protein
MLLGNSNSNINTNTNTNSNSNSNPNLNSNTNQNLNSNVNSQGRTKKRITKHYSNENENKKDDENSDSQCKSNHNHNNQNNQNNNSNNNNNNKNHSHPDNNDLASNTCFSSEQEKNYKNKVGKLRNSIDKITNVFKKSFSPPETTQTKGRFADLRDRTIWTMIMLLSFLGLIYLGNFYCALLVFFIIMSIYSELINIETYVERNKETKFYIFIAWYLYFICTYFFYLRQIQEKLVYLNAIKVFIGLIKYHNLIIFFAYFLGFFIFIFSLTRGYYKYQFRSFAYIHIVLLIFSISSSLIISNIFNGLIW